MKLLTKYRVLPRDCAWYCLFTLLAQMLYQLFLTLLRAVFEDGWPSLAIGVTLVALTALLLPNAVLIPVFRGIVEEHAEQHQADCKANVIIASYLIYALPGEALRWLLCVVPFVGRQVILRFGTFFAPAAAILFESTYVVWSGRYYAIYQLGQYAAADYVAYTVCHLLYLVPYCALSAALYGFLWKRYEKRAARTAAEAKSQTAR